MEGKTTREGLPVVDVNTIKACTRDLNKSDSSVFDEWFAEVKDENPIIAQYIIANSERYSEEYKVFVKGHLTMLYKMLKSQATNNNIEKTFG